MFSQIDINFDFRSDTPSGKDPDTFSPTLRKYHKILWSKPLPNGIVFELVDTSAQSYLHHHSEKGEYFLSSDAVVPSFTREPKISHIINQISVDELNAFKTIGYTIGGMMIFPGNRIDHKMTINGARGFHPRIKDRFDLTVECIRRYYNGENSPLSATLERYGDFFRLFESFNGYVEFFLLQDMVTDNFKCVKFFMPFDGFIKHHRYRQAWQPIFHTCSARLISFKLATAAYLSFVRNIFNSYLIAHLWVQNRMVSRIGAA